MPLLATATAATTMPTTWPPRSVSFTVLRRTRAHFQKAQYCGEQLIERGCSPALVPAPPRPLRVANFASERWGGYFSGGAVRLIGAVECILDEPSWRDVRSD